MAVIEVKHVSKRFGKRQILIDLSFTIDQPGVVALVGPNGSGKSTLLNIMMNLLPADSGEVHILGQTNQSSDMFRRVAFLKDNSVLYPYLTGWDHLNYAANVYRLPKRRLDWVIDHIGIRDFIYRRVRTYSLGMKQHLLLALAILNNPDLIVMDEPLNGLDPTAVLKVRRLIRTLAHHGKTILMSSHTLSEIDAVTNHVLFLKDGQILDEYLALGQQTEDRYRELYVVR